MADNKTVILVEWENIKNPSIRGIAEHDEYMSWSTKQAARGKFRIVSKRREKAPEPAKTPPEAEVPKESKTTKSTNTPPKEDGKSK